MARKIELKNEKLTLTDQKVEGFLERIVTPIGKSAKADVPRRFLGRRAYVIILKG